jgi:hypothetical protein
LRKLNLRKLIRKLKFRKELEEIKVIEIVRDKELFRIKERKLELFRRLLVRDNRVELTNRELVRDLDQDNKFGRFSYKFGGFIYSSSENSYAFNL